MTIVVAQKTLDSIRAADDAPVASCHGYDIFSTINAQHESINESAGGGYAPGSGSGTVAGHIHDHDGDGRGITRGMCGEAYVLAPYTFRNSTTTSFESIATTVTTSYPTVSSKKAIIHAVVSPGITTVSVSCVMSASRNGTTDYQIVNITDSQTAASSGSLVTVPGWFTEDLTVTAAGSGAMKEIDIDIEIKTTDGVSTTFILYYAFVVEKNVAP